MNDLAPKIEKILLRAAVREKKERATEMLMAAASGDAVHLADTLWALVRAGKGPLVGHERSVVELLAPGTFDAQDFLLLLRQLKSANLLWFERWDELGGGLAYHGWSIELEQMLDVLLEKTTDRTPLEWADVSEPAGSSLLFALGRRGIVDAQALPPDALPRFARAFFLYGSWSPEQFEGWERLWNAPTFARAIFACVDEVEHGGIFPAKLAPLVEYATPAQLAMAVEKMLSADFRTIDWLAARGKDIRPLLEERLEELLNDAQYGKGLMSNTGWHVGALARMRAENGQPWPAKWLSLAKAMLKADTAGLREVLQIMDAQTREKLLLEHVADDENWNDKLWPLMVFPTPRLAEKIVEIIRRTPTEDVWPDEREALFKTLRKMGALGQTALETMLDEPKQTTSVLANLMPTKANLLKTLAYCGAPSEIIQRRIQELWLGVGTDERLDLLEQHFDELPPGFVARQLGYVQFHWRAAQVAARLPDTDETHAWRHLCLHIPDALRPVMEEMAKTPQEAIERARKALASELDLFAKSRQKAIEQGRKTLWVDYNDGDDDDLGLDAKLQAFGPEDLPAILQVTACRLETRQDIVWQLCNHFWPSRREIPWIAAFWWGIDCGYSLIAAADVLGEALLPALHARAASGTIATEEWRDVLPLFTKFDPIGGFRYITPFAEYSHMRWILQEGVLVALEKGSQEARTWLVQALSGKTREFALHILSQITVPEATPALQALETQKISAAHKKLLQAALKAQKTRGPTLVRSDKILSARTVHKVRGAVESLHVSRDGQTMVARGGRTVTVWQGQRQGKIRNAEMTSVELSADGRLVLVVDEYNVHVFDPSDNVDEPRITLTPDNGSIQQIVPMPGGRVLILCVSPDVRTPLTLWNLETGAHQVHKMNGLPMQAACIDDERYLVTTMDEKMMIRQLDGGKIIGKLQSWENYDGGGIYAVATGHGGKLVAVLFADGSLMIWDISGSKIKACGRHSHIAPPALVTDPGSSWVVTPGTNEVLTWKDGQPARALVGSGPGPKRIEDEYEGGGMAVFVRPNVVAVGGQSVDVWDLETSQHVGTWDKPITTMVSASGKLFVGDADGNIWQVDVG